MNKRKERNKEERDENQRREKLKILYMYVCRQINRDSVTLQEKEGCILKYERERN